MRLSGPAPEVPRRYACSIICSDGAAQVWQQMVTCLATGRDLRAEAPRGTEDARWCPSVLQGTEIFPEVKQCKLHVTASTYANYEPVHSCGILCMHVCYLLHGAAWRTFTTNIETGELLFVVQRHMICYMRVTNDPYTLQSKGRVSRRTSAITCNNSSSWWETS